MKTNIEIPVLMMMMMMSICVSAGGADGRLLDIQNPTKLLLPQVSRCMLNNQEKVSAVSTLTVCVSMVTGSEPSDPNYAAENTQPVTMTTAAAVTSLTLTDKDDFFSLCS